MDYSQVLRVTERNRVGGASVGGHDSRALGPAEDRRDGVR
jgi:hypothetical protein